MDEEELRDPEYWKRMRDDFLTVDPDRHLILNWSYFPSTGGYFFRLYFKDEHQSIESNFSALATRRPHNDQISKSHGGMVPSDSHLQGPERRKATDERPANRDCQSLPERTNRQALRDIRNPLFPL